MKGQQQIGYVLLVLIGSISAYLLFNELSSTVSHSMVIAEKEKEKVTSPERYLDIPVLNILRSEENKVKLFAIIHNPTFSDIPYTEVTVYLYSDGKITDKNTLTLLGSLEESCYKRIPKRGVCTIEILMNYPQDSPLENAKVTIAVNGYPITKTPSVVSSRSRIAKIPDLAVSFSSVPETSCEEKETSVSVKVVNYGASDASNFRVVLESNVDGVVGSKFISSLSPGSETTVTFTLTLSHGYHVLTAIVDPDNNVSEVNETNNQISTESPVFVGSTIYFAETFSVLPQSTPSLAKAGDKVYLSVRKMSSSSDYIFELEENGAVSEAKKFRYQYYEDHGGWGLWRPGGPVDFLSITSDGKNIYVFAGDIYHDSLVSPGTVILKIDPDNWSIEWTKLYLGMGHPESVDGSGSILYRNGYLYLFRNGDTGPYLMKINPLDGSVVYAKRLSLPENIHTVGEKGIAVCDQYVYVTVEICDPFCHGNFALIQLNESNGSVNWAYKIINTHVGEAEPSVVCDERGVYFASGFTVGFFDRNGTMVWMRDYSSLPFLDMDNFHSIAIDGDFLYVSHVGDPYDDEDGGLIKISKLDGAIFWAKSVDGGGETHVIVEDNNVYAVWENLFLKTDVYGFGLSECKSCEWVNLASGDYIPLRRWNYSPISATVSDVDINIVTCDGTVSSGCRYEVSDITVSRTVYCCSGRVVSCTSCSDCSAKLSSATGTKVVLKTDLNNFTSTCININGSENVVFDCNGHYLLVDGYASGARAIYIQDSNKILVKSCRVSNQRTDTATSHVIHVFGSSDIKIWDLYIFNTNGGILAGSVAGITLGDIVEENVIHGDVSALLRVYGPSDIIGYLNVYNLDYKESVAGSPALGEIIDIDALGSYVVKSFISVQKARVNANFVRKFFRVSEKIGGPGVLSFTDIDIKGKGNIGIEIKTGSGPYSEYPHVEMRDVNVEGWNYGLYVYLSHWGTPEPVRIYGPEKSRFCGNGTDIYIQGGYATDIECNIPSCTILRDSTYPSSWCGSGCTCESC